ncbi:MAG: PAS domain S-box protein [Cyanobacteria bacterium P01_G01_bin.54]
MDTVILPVPPADMLSLLSSSSLTAIMETSPVAIFYADGQGRCRYANSQLCILTGLAFAQLQQSGWLSAVHPEDADRVRQEWAAAQAIGQWFQSEYRFLRPDGSVRWIYSQAQIHENSGTEGTETASGQNSGRDYVGTCTDITDRKQAETELRRYQQAVESASDAIAITDAEGQILYINAAWSALYPHQATADLKHQSLATHLSDPLALKGIFSAVMSGQTWQHELILSDRQGRIMPVFLRVSPIVTPSQEITGLICIATNISEHKRIEGELRQFTQRLQQQVEREQLLNQLSNQIRASLETPIADILSLAITRIRSLLTIDHVQFAWYETSDETPSWQLAAESNSTQSNAVASTPLAPTPPRNYLWAALTPPLLRQETVKLTAIAEELTQTQQLLLEQSGYGALLVVPLIIHQEVVGALLCGHGTSHAWSDPEVLLIQAVVAQLAIALNQSHLYQETQAKAQALETALHELQSTQTQLIQTEKMSSLGQLVAGVAHEINNPVNFIYGNLSHGRDYINDLLALIDCYQQEYPDPTPAVRLLQASIDLDFVQADIQKLFRSMQVGADRIKEIVTSLRTFSRMDEAEMKAVNLHEGIESTLLILHNRLKPKPGSIGIEVVRHYDPHLPLVECYAGQLNQVFMNLLSNAIDALMTHPEQATPTLEIITRCLPERWVQIAFRDNGPGIPTEQQPRLFDPFFTTKVVGQGTGLGLSISYQVVTERHGGRIDVDSVVGKGTTFTVTIPIDQTI